jgi:hypothetical protein
MTTSATTSDHWWQRLRASEPGSIGTGESNSCNTGPGVQRSSDIDVVRTKTIVRWHIRTEGRSPCAVHRREADTDRCRRSSTLPQRVVTTAVRELRELLVLPVVIPEVERVEVHEGIIALLVQRYVVLTSVRHMNFICRRAILALSSVNSTCSERGGPRPLRSGIRITLLPFATDRPVVLGRVFAALMFFTCRLNWTQR